MNVLLKFARLSSLALAVAALLVACSSDEDKQPGLGKIALGLARTGLGNGRYEIAGAGSSGELVQLSRADLVKTGKPVIFTSIPRLGTSLPAIKVTQNGGFDTYMGTDNATFTVQDGVITATRGLIVDLIAQELSLRPAEIFYGGEFPKTYTRAQRHLTGEGTLETLSYDCAIVPHEADEKLTIFRRNHVVRQFTELCQNKTRAFQNSYWVDRRARQIWQSHQSVSREVGHIILQVVVP